MKLMYIMNMRMPTEKAHGIQVMHMCAAFAQAGAEVELVVPTRKTSITEDPFSYYGVERNFSITFLKIPDTVSWGKIGFMFQHVCFVVRAALHAIRARNVSMYFSRDPIVLALLPKRFRRVWETHGDTNSAIIKFCALRMPHIIAISEGLKAYWTHLGILSEKIIVAHDGIDAVEFEQPESRFAARERLGLPQDAKIVLYIGRTDGWKGVETLCESAAHFPPDTRLCIIGGEADQVAALRKKYPSVFFLGYRPYRELKNNQQAGDILVIPNTGKNNISANFTSPLKLFSYMTSGIPIVATDLPSIREILDESIAFFTPPDDPAAMATTIQHVLSDSSTKEKAARAKIRVKNYTWLARARTILANISSW